VDGARLEVADGAHVLDPALDVPAADVLERQVAEGGGARSEHDRAAGGVLVDLVLEPVVEIRHERNTPRAGVDVGAGDDAGGDLVQPSLALGLGGEVASVLAAGLVAVPRAPLAVVALLDAAHVRDALVVVVVVGSAAALGVPRLLLAQPEGQAVAGIEDPAPYLVAVRTDAAMAPVPNGAFAGPAHLGDLGGGEQVLEVGGAGLARARRHGVVEVSGAINAPARVVRAHA
jgi:hypothetical protein